MCACVYIYTHSYTHIDTYSKTFLVIFFLRISYASKYKIYCFLKILYNYKTCIIYKSKLHIYLQQIA